MAGRFELDHALEHVQHVSAMFLAKLQQWCVLSGSRHRRW